MITVDHISMSAIINSNGCYLQTDGRGTHVRRRSHPDTRLLFSLLSIKLNSFQEEDKAIDHSDPSVDYDIFYEKIWPQLVKRTEGFSTAKVS